MPRQCVIKLLGTAEHLQQRRHRTESHSHRSRCEQLGALQLPARARQAPGGGEVKGGEDRGVVVLHLLRIHGLKALVFY